MEAKSREPQIGDKVIVTAGLAAGLRGVVRERTAVLFGNEATFAVEFEMPLGVRVLRAAYLQVSP